MARTSAVAVSTVTSGFNRPITVRVCDRRPVSSSAVNTSGEYTSTALPSGNAKVAGITPTIVKAAPLSESFGQSPTTSAESPLPYRVCQHDDAILAPLFFLGEHATGGGTDAEHAEYAARHRKRLELLGIADSSSAKARNR